MSKNFNINLHYRGKKNNCRSYLFPLKVREQKHEDVLKSKDNPIPNDSRNSTYDAVKFNEVLNWISLQLFSRNKDNSLDLVSNTLDMNLKVLQYLRYSYAYRSYLNFHAEYAEVIRLRLMEQNYDITGYEPEMAEILEIMQKDGFFPRLDELKMKQVSEELSQQLLTRRTTRQEEKDEDRSYNWEIISKHPYKPYFDRLGATLINTLTPEDYLRRNFDNSQDEVPLLHVRECEDIGCSINPQKSPYTKLIPNNVRRKIVESVIEQHSDKDEPILYCGFASGLLGRDLKIIEDLIVTAKRTKLELFFIDKAYATFIKTTAFDLGKPTMEEHIDTTITYKSVIELAEWVSKHLDQDDENPLSIHLFSDVADAEVYLQNSGKKLTLLVGQDFFTDNGCHSSRYSTPGAHEDFMRLAKSSLGENCHYFELIKNDLKDEVYSLKGTVKKDSEVEMHSKLWNCARKQSKIFKNAPLSFFHMSESDINPENYLLVKRQYDENANLLDIKRYTHN